MKLKKLLVSTMLTMIVALFFSVLSLCEIFSIGIETTYAATSGDWEYSVTSEGEKTASITKYNGDKVNIIIPSEIEGYYITGIGGYAFKDSIKIKSVVIPEGVTSIGNTTFSGCTSLADVDIQGV